MSLLRDYRVHSRMLIAVPVLLFGDLLLENRFRLMSFKLPAIVLAVIIALLALAPLLFFIPRLAALRHDGILDYGLLAQLQVRASHGTPVTLALSVAIPLLPYDFVSDPNCDRIEAVAEGPALVRARVCVWQKEFRGKALASSISD